MTEHSREEISERVEEAFDTLKRLPDRDRARLHMAVQEWPLMMRRIFEDAPKGVQTRRPPPTARQIDRMDEALGWMLALAKQNRDFAKAVYLCCGRRMKCAEAAKVCGFHRNTVRAYLNNGLDRIIVIAERTRAA